MTRRCATPGTPGTPMQATALERDVVRRWANVLFGVLLWGSLVAPVAATEVVFVLGEDPIGGPGYFAAAETYYRHAMPDARTVTTLRSLSEVREYLVRNNAAYPWTRIVLVAHGSPLAGLSVPLYSDGKDASLPVVEQAVATREFPTLPAGVIATDGRIVLESCGVGRRSEYLRALAALFSTDAGATPKMEAAQGFVGFYASDHGSPQRSELPIAFRVLRGDLTHWTESRLSEESRRLRDSLPGSQEQVTTQPIKVTVSYPENISSDRFRKVERLVEADATVLNELRSLGISPASLRWRIEAVGNDHGIRLFGEGVALIAYGEAPAPSLP